jgi:2-(1,2-epoxy-1,2-dihydrophenyl)acetyl-CoA isomerase
MIRPTSTTVSPTTLTPRCQALLHATVPVVAAVNGPCAGGGFGLALLADVTVAARSAYFLVPQVSSLGIAPDAGPNVGG